MPYIFLFGNILNIEEPENAPIHFSNAAAEGGFCELKMKIDQQAANIGIRPLKAGRFISISRKRIEDIRLMSILTHFQEIILRIKELELL